MPINGVCACTSDCVSGAICYDYTGSRTPLNALYGIFNGTCLKPGSFGSGCLQNLDCKSLGVDVACVHVDEYFSQRILGDLTTGSIGKSITGTCVKLATENSLCNLNPTGPNPNIGCQSGFSCTSHYGFNSVGSCQPKNAVGSGCLYSDDCTDGSTCVDSFWNIVTAKSDTTSYWPRPSKCILMNGILNSDCSYAFDNSNVVNQGCVSGLICSGNLGVSVAGLCKINLLSSCSKSEDCVFGTSCYDKNGEFFSSSAVESGTCLAGLGSLCSYSSQCKTETSCVYQTSSGQIILSSQFRDSSSPFMLFGNCVTLGNNGYPCNYNYTGIAGAYYGCNSNAATPLYCYNRTKLSTEGICQPYVRGSNDEPFSISQFVEVSSLSKRREFLFPRSTSQLIGRLDLPPALAPNADFDVVEYETSIVNQKNYNEKLVVKIESSELFETESAGTGLSRRLEPVTVTWTTFYTAILFLITISTFVNQVVIPNVIYKPESCLQDINCHSYKGKEYESYFFSPVRFVNLILDVFF